MRKYFIFLLFLFVTQTVYSDYITGGCEISSLYAFLDNKSYLSATWQKNSYTCTSGYFLPADGIECVACPEGYSCPGGTYDYNSTNAQGINLTIPIIQNTTNICANNLLKTIGKTSFLKATWQINTYNCSSGYYLPADTDGCTICLLNHYCSGGTYAYNETENQGIIECPSGTFAPEGASGCHAHKLHIGDEVMYLRSTKRTTPSLNVAYGNDVFYANMTTTQTVMTAGSSHYFKTIYNNTEYYICDDTSCPQ